MQKSKDSAEKFITPEGSNYILFARGYSGDFLKDLYYSKDLLLQKQSLRVLYDDEDFANPILEALERLSLDSDLAISAKDYNTNFFGIDFAEIINFTGNVKPWIDYSREFESNLVKIDDKKNLDILKNFMQASFASTLAQKEGRNVLVPLQEKQAKIENGMELSFLDPKIKSYIILDSFKTPVASFSLVLLQNEVQLQSVAGRSSFKSSVATAKLPLIMSAVFNLVSQIEPALPITFTSSKPKVAQLYINLGCKTIDGRKGFVVNCHT